MDKKITKFQHHIDNIKEAVKADDINSIGKSVNQIEKNIVEIAESNFVDKVFFALENSIKANAMFLDDMKSPYKIFQTKSENIEYDTTASCIKLKPESYVQEGIVQSIFFQPQYPSRINEMTLMVDDYIPKGAAIHYFVSVDGKDFFPIRPNISELTVLAKPGQGIFIKAKLIKNRNFESPKIFAWAVLYKDPIVERLHGIQNYDLSRFDAQLIGETVLIRDRFNDDRVVMVIDPLSSTELHYDLANDNRLDYVMDRVDDRVIKEKMNYGPYFNAKGEYEEVLLGTTKQLVYDDPVEGEIPEEFMDDLVQITEEEIAKEGGA